MRCIIIPTYNERGNITRLIPEILHVVPDAKIVVVDDNSPDGTGEAVLKLAERFPGVSLLSRPRKEGLGKAYVHAMTEVLSRFPDVSRIVIMDADLSHASRYLPAMLDASARYGVVVGSRYVSGGGVKGWELWRRLLSAGGNRYARAVTGLPVRDITAGYCVFDASFLKRVPFDEMDSSGYAFQIELKYLLARAGASFKEVPIIFENRTGGESKISGHIISEGILAPWKMRIKK